MSEEQVQEQTQQEPQDNTQESPGKKKKLKKSRRPEVKVNLKKLVHDSGNLNIATDYGDYLFWANQVLEISKEEADELIKVRTEQRRPKPCDLIVVQDD